MGKMLIYVGLALVALGLLVSAGDKFGIKLGQLPGDIVWKGQNSTVYFPVMTCVLLSVIASVVMWLVGRR
jgi:hypothetical protein